MSLDNAISMEPVKKKLENLQEHLPNQNPMVYEFAEFLAARLNPELVPPGFVMATELALADLRKGVDGFTGKPISGNLSGYPRQLYAGLRMYIPEIIKAVCPEDFAKGVKEFYDQVYTKMKKKSMFRC